MKKLLPVLIVFTAAWWFAQRSGQFQSFHNAASAATSSPSVDAVLEQAYREQKSNLQVQGQAVVVNILRDDAEGSRHQRFLVRLDSGLTLLIAHNIDLAPRIDSLREGDRIAFYGEYEWNNKGGVIHWTHRDPQHRHIDGWLEYRGRRYQ